MNLQPLGMYPLGTCKRMREVYSRGESALKLSPISGGANGKGASNYRDVAEAACQTAKASGSAVGRHDRGRYRGGVVRPGALHQYDGDLASRQHHQDRFWRVREIAVSVPCRRGDEQGQRKRSNRVPAAICRRRSGCRIAPLGLPTTPMMHRRKAIPILSELLVRRAGRRSVQPQLKRLLVGSSECRRICGLDATSAPQKQHRRLLGSRK